VTAPVAPPEFACTIGRDALLAALRFARIAIPSRPPMVVLSGILLDASADNGGLVVSAWDYEVHCREEVPAPGARGRVLAPGRELYDMISVLPKGTDVVMSKTGKGLRIEGGNGAFNLPLLPIEDYPVMPDRPREEAALTGNHVKMLARVAKAAGRDDTLPILTTVHLTPSLDGTLEAAATDRYRLAVADLKVRYDGPANLKVPAALLTKIAPTFGKEKRVVLGITGGQHGDGLVMLEAGTRRMVARTMDGEFPKYRSLLPDSHAVEYVLPREDTLDATHRTAIVTHRGAPVRINYVDGTLVFESGNNPDHDAYARFVVEGVERTINDVPQDAEVAFNPKFLVDGLNALTGGKVTMGAAGQNRPHVFTSEEDAGFTYLLMPVRMSG
jgi:DNA polymerase-3 subunit beta